MFVETQATVDVPFRQAAALLDDALAGGALVACSQRAAGAGLTCLTRVGPSGSGRFGKAVRVHLLPSRWVGGHVVVALRWEPTGRTAALFPSLDADLMVHPDPPGSIVSIVGSYRPPLGALGARVDRVVLARAAHATLRALTEDIAQRLSDHYQRLLPGERQPGER